MEQTINAHTQVARNNSLRLKTNGLA